LKTKNVILLIIGTCNISAIDIMRILLNDGDDHSAETVTSVVATNGTTSGDVATSHDFTGMTLLSVRGEVFSKTMVLMCISF
jgi:hypothetical protein